MRKYIITELDKLFSEGKEVELIVNEKVHKDVVQFIEKISQLEAYSNKIKMTFKQPGPKEEFCEWERKTPLSFIHTSCGVEELSMSGLVGDKEINVLSEKHCKLCPICQRTIKLKDRA